MKMPFAMRKLIHISCNMWIHDLPDMLLRHVHVTTTYYCYVITFISCYSHVFVVVTTKQNLIPYELPDIDLVSYKKSLNTVYVAAVLIENEWERDIFIGDGNSYEYNNITYHNVPLSKGLTYYVFVRAYSYIHTTSVSL